VDSQFEYERSVPFGIRPAGTQEQADSTQSELTYLASESQRRAASLVRPVGEGPFPAVLYVHWYETEACDSNRTQFLEEAKQMAAKGVLSLLIETMWSDREWFLKRTQAEDYDASIQQVIELRRAMDLLLSQPGVDTDRFAYVGHDFGAMYGVLAGSVDQRPSHYVLMAGTPRFSDWFLYYPQLEGEERDDFIQQMKSLDPIERVSTLSPAPILFQFGSNDLHVPVERADAFSLASGAPKTDLRYDVGHSLSAQAQSDRMAWLSEQLCLEAS
jgi:dienelactone hydrolase